MTKTITIASSAVSSKLLDPTNEVKLLLTELLSYYVAGYENTASFKAGRWDGKSTMFDWASDTFPMGFTSTVNAALVNMGYKVVNVRKPLPAPLGQLPKRLGNFEYTDKYDYQWNGIQQLEKRGAMISRLATGAGKTFQAALAIARINRPTLIITKRQTLMYQFWERLKEFGYDPGLVGDNRFRLLPDLTIAMSQTIAKKLEDADTREMMQDYLKSVEFLIGEEAHDISDSSYWNSVKECTNAQYRMGLTATPFMKDKSEANMKLLGAFGPVGLDVSEKTLIDRGINATPSIKFAVYNRPPKVKFGSNYQKAMLEAITYADDRNNTIVNHTKKAIEHKLPVLILVNRQEHGKELVRLFRNEKIKAEFVYGESDAEKRRSSLKRLGNGQLQVLIGSTILDAGVDVPGIGLLILAGGGKAEVGYRQRIGRGLRSKPKGPNVCFVLDFMDEHNAHLNDHYRERLKIIKSTSGFAENLLGPHQDFDWSLFK